MSGPQGDFFASH